MSPTTPLPVVDVWVVALDPPAAQVERLSALLDKEEEARADRFLKPDHGRRHRVAHGALRAILAGYANTAPQALRFARGPHGKPYLETDAARRFSLAHSADLAVVAVAHHVEVGVDVEALRPVPQALAVARSRFTHEEARALEQAPAAERDARFLALWTVHEATLKATGQGLAAAPADTAAATQALPLGDRHVGAVAALCPAFTLTVRTFTPA